MKNFVRLVQFAWRYRVRFGLSIGCAAMVAVLFFTELGAVYPLLHILFDSQNPKRWVAEKIASIEQEIVILDARSLEAKTVLDATEAGETSYDALKSRLERLRDDQRAQETELRDLEHRLSVTETRENLGQPLRNDGAELEGVRQAVRLSEARLKESRECRRLFDKGGAAGITRRIRAIGEEKTERAKVLFRYRVAQPYIDRYLPNDSLQKFAALDGARHGWRGLQGILHVPARDAGRLVMQLTLFDIRNVFFRRTINLDLASFSDQGSSELMARFTNDMDSFGQGLNTLMSKVIREPLRFASCLGGALWFNWRLTCLTLILVPISARPRTAWARS